MSDTRPVPERSDFPWWTTPAGINIGFLLPMLLLIAYAGYENFRGLTIRGIPFLTGKYIALGAGILLLISLGGWVGSQVSLPKSRRPGAEAYHWDRAATIVGVVALLAYVYFFRQFVGNPVLLFKTLTGAYRPDRTNLELTVGVTSFVNFAPVFFSIYAYRAIYCQVAVGRHMHWLFVLLLALTALRVYAWSERLALIEATVSVGLSVAAWLNRQSGWGIKLLARAGPFVGIPFFILYFGIAEYVRSWTSATYHGRGDFWEFALGRLASYYYTSLNNGAGLLSILDWPSFKFQFTLWWLYKAPLIGPLFSAYVGATTEEFGDFLQKYADLEFNNPSGIYSVIFDLGLPLGILYFSLQGFFGGMLFRAFRSNSFLAALLYPLLFLAFLEIFRYPYLGAPRAFTWAAGIIVAYLSGQNRLKLCPRREVPT